MNWIIVALGLSVVTASATFAQRTDSSAVTLTAAHQILTRHTPVSADDIRELVETVRRSAYSLNVPLALIGSLITGVGVTMTT
jgi:hypothetical protein